MKKTIFFCFLITNVFIQAENITFTHFLSLLKEFHQYTSFAELPTNHHAYTNIIEDQPYNENYQLFKKFLPSKELIYCDSNDISLGKGAYLKTPNFIIAILPKVCGSFLDSNKLFFMEYNVTSWTLITYANNGKILDYTTIGKSFEMSKQTIYQMDIDYDTHLSAFKITNYTIKNGNYSLRYNDTPYIITTNYYSFSNNGKIISTPAKKTTETYIPYKIPTALTFQKFKSYFTQTTLNKKNINHTLFQSDNDDLPQEQLYLTLPESICNDCYPELFSWNMGKYIETKKHFLFFISNYCEYPIEDEKDRYVKYILLVYNKKEKLENIITIWEDLYESEETEETLNKKINTALKQKINKYLNF